MKKLYFENKITIDSCADEINKTGKDIVVKTTMHCACGETYGFHGEKFDLILCECCYQDAEFFNKGE